MMFKKLDMRLQKNRDKLIYHGGDMIVAGVIGLLLGVLLCQIL
jgi:hypothetical protein